MRISLPLRNLIVGSLGLFLILLAFLGCGKIPPPKAAKPEAAVDLNVARTQAEQGDATAKNILGDVYAKGKGVPQDYALAAKWYRQAAEQGSAAAQVNLAALYAAGAGVKIEIGRAHV